MLEGGIKMIDKREEEILKRYQFWKLLLGNTGEGNVRNNNLEENHINVCLGCEGGGCSAGGGGCSSCHGCSSCSG